MLHLQLKLTFLKTPPQLPLNSAVKYLQTWAKPGAALQTPLLLIH